MADTENHVLLEVTLKVTVPKELDGFVAGFEEGFRSGRAFQSFVGSRREPEEEEAR